LDRAWGRLQFPAAPSRVPSDTPVCLSHAGGQNKLQVYRKLDGPTLSAEPLFTKETLTDPSRLNGQAPSTIHMHPNGRFLYLANRATAMTDFQGKRVFAGGENSIAVSSINQETGEPAL